MTRARALVLASVAGGLGAVASGGLRLLDSRSSYVGLLGSALVLGVALAVDALRPAPGEALAREVRAMHAEIIALRAEVAKLEETATIAKISADATSRTSGAGRSGSFPAL